MTTEYRSSTYVPTAQLHTIRGADGESGFVFGFVGTKKTIVANPEAGSLRENKRTAMPNQRCSVNTYYENGEIGSFGPDLVVNLDDDTTEDDGFSCFVDEKLQRWKREFNKPVNIMWGGAKYGTSLSDNTYDAVTGDAFDAITAYFTTQGEGVYYVPASDGIFVTDRSVPMPSNTTIINDGYLAAKKDGGFRLIAPTKVVNITITGAGTYDGNAHVDGPRVSGAGLIWVQFCENVKIINTKIRNSPLFAVGIELCRQVWVSGNFVYNKTGCIDDTETPTETKSGDNQDGIHAIDTSDLWIERNQIYSVDDSTAVTFRDPAGDASDTESPWYKFGSYGTDRYTNINVINNLCFPDVADNISSGTPGVDPGTERKLVGHGIRLSDDSPHSTDEMRLKDVIIRDNHFVGGIGLLIGDTSGTTHTVAENVVVENNFILQAGSQYAGDVDEVNIYSDINRGISGAIFVSQIDKLSIFNNRIIDCGVVGIYVRSGSDITVRKNLVKDVVINNMVDSPKSHEKSGINLSSNVGVIAGVIVEENTIDTTDGAGIWVQDNDVNLGVSKIQLINNIIKSPNQGATVAGAIKTAFIQKGQLIERGNEIIDFTPGGSYVGLGEILLDKSKENVFSVESWNTDLYDGVNSNRSFDLIDNSSTLTTSVETTYKGIENVLNLTGKPLDGIASLDISSGLNGGIADLEIDYWAVSPATLLVTDNDTGRDPYQLPSTTGWSRAKISVGLSTDSPQNLNFKIMHTTATPLASVGNWVNNSATNAFSSMSAITDGYNFIKTDTDKINRAGSTITSGTTGDLILVEFDYVKNSGIGGPSLRLRNGGQDGTDSTLLQVPVNQPNVTGHKFAVLSSTASYDTLVINSNSVQSPHNFDVTNLEVGMITTDGVIRIGKASLIARD